MKLTAGGGRPQLIAGVGPTNEDYVDDMRPEGEFGDLIAELKEWNNGDGIDVDSWIGCVGCFEHAIGYSRLFWPEFLEHDGAVFWKERFDEANYVSWMKALQGNREGVQAVMNHLHIVKMFPSEPEDPTSEQLVYLGRVLKDVWSTKLARDFPCWQTTVRFPVDDFDDLIDYQITFLRVAG